MAVAVLEGSFAASATYRHAERNSSNVHCGSRSRSHSNTSIPLPGTNCSLREADGFSLGPVSEAWSLEKSQDSVPPGIGTGLPNLSVQAIRHLPAGFFCRLKMNAPPSL